MLLGSFGIDLMIITPGVNLEPLESKMNVIKLTKPKIYKR